jgi:hypothetical protein
MGLMECNEPVIIRVVPLGDTWCQFVSSKDIPHVMFGVSPLKRPEQ